jgi:hypothetical protein
LASNCVLRDNVARAGGGAYRGTLVGCLLVNNLASDQGGGAWGGTLNGCTLADNWSGSSGGGVASGVLNNCLLTDNRTTVAGAGAEGGVLRNCTLVGNSSFGTGGGVVQGRLANCIVYGNRGMQGLGNYTESTLDYCCTTPLPTNGAGNINADPRFADLMAGDFRLSSSSPCLNAGDSAYVTNRTDLEGNSRIVGGTVDLGACEYQGPGSAISCAWLQQYGLPTDGSTDDVDLDGDGRTTCAEWRCQTDPTDARSVLQFLAPVADGTNLTLSWQSVAGVTYALERSTNLGKAPCFGYSMIVTTRTGQGGTATYTITNAIAAGTGFYRVGVWPRP